VGSMPLSIVWEKKVQTRESRQKKMGPPFSISPRGVEKVSDLKVPTGKGGGEALGNLSVLGASCIGKEWGNRLNNRWKPSKTLPKKNLWRKKPDGKAGHKLDFV